MATVAKLLPANIQSTHNHHTYRILVIISLQLHNQPLQKFGLHQATLHHNNHINSWFHVIQWLRLKFEQRTCHSNCYQIVQFILVWHHTKFTRNQFISTRTQASVKGNIYEIISEEFSPLNINCVKWNYHELQQTKRIGCIPNFIKMDWEIYAEIFVEMFTFSPNCDFEWKSSSFKLISSINS